MSLSLQKVSASQACEEAQRYITAVAAEIAEADDRQAGWGERYGHAKELYHTFREVASETQEFQDYQEDLQRKLETIRIWITALEPPAPPSVTPSFTSDFALGEKLGGYHLKLSELIAKSPSPGWLHEEDLIPFAATLEALRLHDSRFARTRFVQKAEERDFLDKTIPTAIWENQLGLAKAAMELFEAEEPPVERGSLEQLLYQSRRCLSMRERLNSVVFSLSMSRISSDEQKAFAKEAVKTCIQKLYKLRSILSAEEQSVLSPDQQPMIAQMLKELNTAFQNASGYGWLPWRSPKNEVVIENGRKKGMIMAFLKRCCFPANSPQPFRVTWMDQ